MDAVNAALDVFGFLLALILLLGISRPRTERSQPTAISRWMLGFACVMLLSDALSLLFFMDTRYPMIILDAIGFVASFAINALYARYVRAVLEVQTPFAKAMSVVSVILCLIGAGLWVATCFRPFFFDLQRNIVSNERLYWICSIPGGLALLSGVVLLLRYHSRISLEEKLLMLGLPILPLTSWLLQKLVPGLQCRYELILLSLFINCSYINARRDRELEKQMQVFRLRTTLERVKPHYIYNVLTSIYYLCDTSPEAAQHAIGVFSDYLRDALQVMDRSELVSFSWEMQLIRNYLELEKLRFGSRLQIEYGIEETDFSVPPFTVQPLVENAVKHGMLGAGAVTVRLESRRTEGGCTIVVQDNGTGFDPGSSDDSESPSGLRNVREILALTCGGSLRIDSSHGRGTTAELFFPDRQGAAGNFLRNN